MIDVGKDNVIVTNRGELEERPVANRGEVSTSVKRAISPNEGMRPDEIFLDRISVQLDRYGIRAQFEYRLLKHDNSDVLMGPQVLYVGLDRGIQMDGVRVEDALWLINV